VTPISFQFETSGSSPNLSDGSKTRNLPENGQVTEKIITIYRVAHMQIT